MRFMVTTTESGQMLKQILQHRFHFSRKMFRRLRTEQRVTVNGQLRYDTARVQAGDVVVVELMETDESGITPEPIAFTVVAEDDHLLVVDKPAGLVVHPTLGYQAGTLANGVAYYALQRGEAYPFRPVTRLDKDTSGLMVIAKHAHAHAILAKQMKHKTYQRSYIVVCHGQLKRDAGMIDLPIGRSTTSIIERVIDPVDGKRAITHYRTLERFKDATLVELTLQTGRTHQIRVHLAAMGHPLFGDTLYGGCANQIARQALHAKRLGLLHPIERQWQQWEIPVAKDIVNLLEMLV